MPYLNTQQVAEYLGISPRTVESLRLTSRGPVFTRIGRSVRYSQAALDEWLTINRYSSTASASEPSVRG